MDVIVPAGQCHGVPARLADAGPATRRDDARWWLVVAAGGVLSGLVGIAMTLLLHLVQHAAFGHPEDTFLLGVQHSTAMRRVLVLAVAGLVAGVGWWLLRRLNPVHTVAAAVGDKHEILPVRSTTIDGCLQIVVVGMGASLGREGAPRQVAAALGGWLAQRCGLDVAQRRILVAACAGAGLAAVYDVPLGGVLFAAEVLLGSLSMRVVLPAALASALATAVSWTALGTQPVYHLTRLHMTASLLVWAILVGPVVGVVAFGFHTVTTYAGARAASGPRAVPIALAAFTALGAVAIVCPGLLGNGKGALQAALTGSAGVTTAAALVLLKPLATAACLRSGAVGGLLTPSMATGGLLGAAAGQLWLDAWPGAQIGAFAFVGAGAMLATTQRAPLCAAALLLEFTGTGVQLIVPLAFAITGSLVIDGLLRRRATTRRDHLRNGRAGTARWADGSGAEPE